ncbi:MAG TPA: NYN domain-containing protein [candidate division Zixibacteria bacterium]|nr:NYN domain-containing protein [candidate division Zixibacteria bacterium]
MSKNVAVFVDVANLYYSARGQDVDVDYVALLKYATKGRDLIRAYAYTGLDPENESQRKFIEFLGKNGYKPVVKDIRKFGDGRVKANLDIELVVDLFRLADRMDIAVIISGDGDFAPAIKALQDKGVRCEVISFRPNTSSDLIAVADEFIDIMKVASIGRNSKEALAARGIVTPEMPAKEVVPEFGFREASPSVAAAALAAIREGKDGGKTGRNGKSGRGRGRAAPQAAAEPASEVPAPDEGVAVAEDAAAPQDGEGRKRRRRRGGRGRGRRRREQAVTPESAEAAEPGEIGWVELDDISQLEDADELALLGDEREYSFEEADAETLAELGLTPEAQPAGAEPAAEAKPRRTRSRRATADAEAETEAAAAEAEAEAKPRRTRRARADAKAASAAPEAGIEAEAKPKRTRSRRTTAEAEPEPQAEAEAKPKRTRARKAKAEAPVEAPAEAAATEGPEGGEGIWQRFRSARGRKPAS